MCLLKSPSFLGNHDKDQALVGLKRSLSEGGGFDGCPGLSPPVNLCGHWYKTPDPLYAA